VALRCEEARRRLLADAADGQAGEHLMDCADCFEALEAADPVIRLLVDALPAPAPAPVRTAASVLARWRPRQGRLQVALTAALAASAAVAAVVIEALVGVEPARLAALAAAGTAMLDAGAAVLLVVQSLRAAALEIPGLLGGLSLATLAVCALWMRFVLSLPNWRSA
jgi:hypothetical protein